MQVTLASEVEIKGCGLHSGLPVRMCVAPAPADHGFVFQRTDAGEQDGRIAASAANWREAQLCTRLENAAGISIGTVEHLLAALAGCGIHNALIRIDGPEVPALDGSAAPFVRRFLAAGLRVQSRPLKVIRVLRRVEVHSGSAMARLDPGEGMAISFDIDFPDAAIGHQRKMLDMANGTFVRELGDSRTFCRRADVDRMRAAGMGLGGSLDNAVVVDGPEVLTPGGLRHADEPVRHKMLDALGDLALAGRPILGHYTGVRAGHALTGRLVCALLAQADTHEIVVADDQMQARLPGGPCLIETLRLSA